MDKYTVDKKTIMVAVLAGVIGILIGGCVVGFHGKDQERYGRGDDFGRDWGHGSQMMQGNGRGNIEGNMSDSMNGMMNGIDNKTGDEFDKAFIDEMILHHQGAVKMAQLALANAKHQEVKDLANGIISAQNKEIDQMKQWKTMWYSN